MEYHLLKLNKRWTLRINFWFYISKFTELGDGLKQKREAVTAKAHPQQRELAPRRDWGETYPKITGRGVREQ